MKEALLILSLAVLSTMGVPKSVRLADTNPTMVRIASCADDVVEVCGMLPEYARSAWCPITLTMAMKEGNCFADPKCPPGTPKEKCNDDGSACGVLQVHSPEREIEGATCEKVRADRKLGLRVGLALMLRLSKKCGTIGAGLSAYGTNGACPPNGVVFGFAKERLRLAGVDPSAPWSPGA